MKRVPGVAVAVAMLAPSAHAGVIVQTGEFVITRTAAVPGGGAYSFHSPVFEHFDTLGGVRRLGMVRARCRTWNFRSQVVLDNPLNEPQHVHYTPVSSVHLGIPQTGFEVPREGQNIFAGPLERVEETWSYSEVWNSGPEFTLRDGESNLQFIGSGPWPLGPLQGTVEFEEFRFINWSAAGPGIGWSYDGEFRLTVDLEYHWIPSDCPVDLTTTASPSFYLYGQPDGIVDNEDFFYYLAQFAAGNAAVADMTTTAIPGSPGYGVPNAVIDNDDFFFFLTLFAAGC